MNALRKDRLQFASWCLFVAAVLFALLSLLVRGGPRVATLAVSDGLLFGLFGGGFFLKGLGRHSWAIVLGATLGSALSLLNALAVGTFHPYHLVVLKHWRAYPPELIDAARSSMAGALIGVAFGIGVGRTTYFLSGRKRDTENRPHATPTTGSSRIGRLLWMMGPLIVGLGAILAGGGDSLSGRAFVLGVILVVLSSVFLLAGRLGRPIDWLSTRHEGAADARRHIGQERKP